MPLMKWISMIVIVLASFMIATIAGKTLAKREAGQIISSYNGRLEKRPFCNAFTGCGKKRSTGIAGPGGLEDSSDDGPMESNEWLQYLRLSQKIMDEARSWEILQSKVNQFGPIGMTVARRRRSLDRPSTMFTSK